MHPLTFTMGLEQTTIHGLFVAKILLPIVTLRFLYIWITRKTKPPLSVLFVDFATSFLPLFFLFAFILFTQGSVIHISPLKSVLGLSYTQEPKFLTPLKAALGIYLISANIVLHLILAKSITKSSISKLQPYSFGVNTILTFILFF